MRLIVFIGRSLQKNKNKAEKSSSAQFRKRNPPEAPFVHFLPEIRQSWHISPSEG